MTTLHIIDHTGDKRVEFETKAIPREVVDLFNDALSKGGMAYQIGPDIKETVHSLDEVADGTTKVVVRPPMVGG